MTIICGIDFSEISESACETAVVLAERHDEPLVLVHAVALVTVPSMYMNGSLLDDMQASAEGALEELAGRIAGRSNRVTTRVRVGMPDDVLLKEADEASARLIVVGSTGQRGLKWLLGSTTDRVASRARRPVLIVRGRFPAAEWLREKRPLRVAVAADLASSTDSAIEWARHLPEHAPCEFVVAHVSWPPEDFERLAIEPPMDLDRTHPLVMEVIQRDLSSAAARLQGQGETKIVVESNMGNIGEAVSRIAERTDADLIVVGKGRAEGRHWWDRSASLAVIRHASMSVVCIPESADEERLPEPRVTRVLAATDFSRLGNAAVAYALSITPPGGEVMLVHALDENEAGADERERRRQVLEGFAKAAGNGVKVTVEILTGDDPAHLINAAAERFGAAVICIGSRGRSGLAKAFLGSVSQSLLLRSRRPVLVVPTDGRKADG